MVTGQPSDGDRDPKPRGRLEALSLLPYRLTLSRPWRSARGLTGERQGWLVRAASDGLRGYGDCAPLDQARTESRPDAERALKGWQQRLRGLTIDSALELLATSPPLETPSAAFALECALLDLQSRLAGMPLRHWIAGSDAPSVADWIDVNAMLGASTEVSREDLAETLGLGYGVLKVKVGCLHPDTEIGRLRSLASDLPPGISLRLDANGAWDRETARRVIAALSELPIESLEEPLSQPDPAVLARLQALASFPLGLDESLAPWVRQGETWPFPVRRAVIKPAVIGGVSASLSLAQRLRAAGIEVVVTGLIDSAAGLWATAQVAAAVGGTIAHGLATWDWLAKDLGQPPVPRSGRLELPQSPGSGFDPDAREADHA